MEESVREIRGRIVDIHKKEIYEGEVRIREGKIERIIRKKVREKCFILPGFVDAHVHIESSMLTPENFAEAVISHGTVAVVADPHEIANVLGKEGVEYMVEKAKRSELYIRYGVPSCVPATEFETAGARLDADEIEELFRKYPEMHLAEMMNFPGVIRGEENVWKKIETARRYGRKVDGHAPGLRGVELEKYVEAGIETDHECSTLEEAEEKIRMGMKILIREGSAAKNFEALHPLIEKHPDEVMFCTDDIHPDDLMQGHIDRIVRMALGKGHDLWKVLRAAGYNAVKYYGLDIGMLREGDPADMLVVEDLRKMNVQEVYRRGKKVERKGRAKGTGTEAQPNRFKVRIPDEEEIKVRNGQRRKIRVIVAEDGSLVTGEWITEPRIRGEEIVTDTERDILKLVVLERYRGESRPAVGWIRGFGMKKGALAGTVAHDSHNIIVVGTSDREIIKAIRILSEEKGALVAIEEGKETVLPLPVAGLMSNQRGEEVADRYAELNRHAVEMGTRMRAPFMTLSFMALLVIPELKMSDKGLFDVKKFRFTEIFAE